MHREITSHLSSSVINSNSTNQDILAATSQILEALGCKDLRPAISEADRLDHEIINELNQSSQAFLQRPGEYQKQQLLQALDAAIEKIQKEYKHIQQLRKQAEIRLSQYQQDTPSLSFVTWFMRSSFTTLQKFFDSDDSSLVTRYSEIEQKREKNLETLRSCRNDLVDIKPNFSRKLLIDPPIEIEEGDNPAVDNPEDNPEDTAGDYVPPASSTRYKYVQVTIEEPNPLGGGMQTVSKWEYVPDDNGDYVLKNGIYVPYNSHSNSNDNSPGATAAGVIVSVLFFCVCCGCIARRCSGDISVSNYSPRRATNLKPVLPSNETKQNLSQDNFSKDFSKTDPHTSAKENDNNQETVVNSQSFFTDDNFKVKTSTHSTSVEIHVDPSTLGA